MPKSQAELLSETADKRNASLMTLNDRMVTVCTSALAISLTFRSSIAGTAPVHVWLLKTAWIGLAVATVGGVVLHLGMAASANALMRAIWNNQSSAAPHKIYAAIQFLALAGFLVGFICLIAFGIINTK